MTKADKLNFSLIGRSLDLRQMHCRCSLAMRLDDNRGARVPETKETMEKA